MNNEEWANSVTKRAMEMAEMDPELMPRVNLIIAKEKLLKMASGVLALILFMLLLVAIPVVIIAWRAAL